MALLIEHFGGAFPTWLAPIQVRILPVAEAFDDYARKLVKALRTDFVRAEADLTGDTLNKRIRNAATAKVPNTLIVGERELAEGNVTLKRYGEQEQQTMPFAELQGRLSAAIKDRAPRI